MYRVLLPVDVDEGRADEQVDTLLSLPADADELSVTLLHVYEEIDTPADEAGTIFIDELNESLDELRDVPPSMELAERRLDDVGIEYDRRELVGDPADGVAEVATEIDADCILLGMRQRSPVGKAVFGSVSQTVILESDRPVMIARQ